MRINQNISAMNTYSRLTSANNNKSASLAKLSSGLRINKAGDDAAGLAISEKMRGQVGGLKQSVRNAQDGISLIQTAEGALTETHSILQRMRDLAVQASSDTNTLEDRKEIQKEMNELSVEITRISTDTEFNTKKLLNGNLAGEGNQLTFHIGANKGQNMKLNIADMGAKALNVHGVKVSGVDAVSGVASTGTLSGLTVTAKETGVGGDDYSVVFTAPTNSGQDLTVTTSGDVVKVALGSAVGSGASVSTAAEIAAAINAHADASKLVTAEGATNVVGNADTLSLAGGVDEVKHVEAFDGSGIHIQTQEAADAAIEIIDAATAKVSEERSKLGSVQNRLEHTINNLTATAENLSAAESRIRDVDMAEEMMEFTKNNILSQAATSMLAQANQMPNSVLQLLQ